MRWSAGSGGGLVALATVLPGSQSNGSHPSPVTEATSGKNWMFIIGAWGETPTLDGRHHTNEVTSDYIRCMAGCRSSFRFQLIGHSVFLPSPFK